MRAIPETDQRRRYTLHQGPVQYYKELYQFLYQRVKELRLERKAVTIDFLLRIAEENEQSIKDLTYSGKRSLIHRFMQYFGLSIREITGHSGANLDQMEEDQKTIIDNFKAEYKRLIETYHIPVHNIFNMDQSGILYENPTTRTIEFSGSKDVFVQLNGEEKKRLTLISLIDSGGLLYTQILVYKGTPDARIKDEVEQLDSVESLHTVQEKGWTDGGVLIEWLGKIWRPLTSLRQGPKLLLIDSYPLHQDFKNDFSEYDTHVLYVPKGLTWALQPLDSGFFKALKDELKKIWITKQGTIFTSEADKRRTISDSLKEVWNIQSGQDNRCFWRKAGLEYPRGLEVVREDQGRMEEERPIDNINAENPEMISLEEERTELSDMLIIEELNNDETRTERLDHNMLIVENEGDELN